MTDAAATLGVCGAFTDAAERCHGQIRVLEQVGSLLHGECELCGEMAALPVAHADPHLRRRLRVQRANLPAAFVGKRFEDTPDNHQALEAIRSWFACFDSGALPAPALFGQAGRGKSHLLSAICMRLMNELDQAVMFCSARSLLRGLQRFDDEAERRQTWSRAATVDILALDDLGAQQITDWRHDQIADLIDERYQHERPILVATNWPPSQWDRVMDERTASRLRGMTFGVELRGPDRRGLSERNDVGCVSL